MFSTRKLDEIGGVHQQVSSLPWEWRHGWALQSERRLFWKQNLDVVWTCWRWSWCCLDIPWTCNHRLFFWTIPNEKPQQWTGFQPFPTGRDSHWDCHRDCHIKIPMLIRWSTGAKPTMPPERNRFALKFAVPPTPGVQHDLGTEAEMFGDIKAIFVAFSHRCGSLEWYGMMMMDDAMRIEINDIYVIWYEMIWDDAMIYIYNYIYIRRLIWMWMWDSLISILGQHMSPFCRGSILLTHLSSVMCKRSFAMTAKWMGIVS